MTGLDIVPPSQRPPGGFVRYSFDIMVAIGLRAAGARYVGRRPIAAGVTAGAIALAALPILASEAGPIAGHLVTRAAVLIATSAAAGIGSIAALYRRWFRFARVLAAIAVGAVLAGWAVAQYPNLVLGLTVSAAAPPSTLPVTLAVRAAGFAVTLPALALLLRTFTRALITDLGMWYEVAPNTCIPQRSGPVHGAEQNP